MKLVLESSYFPPISYMNLLLNAEAYHIDLEEPYSKQTYRNRMTILTSQGAIGLTVPIEKKGQRKVATCKISYAENWQVKHLRTIESAYGKSPFFEHYFPYIENFYAQKFVLLSELNKESLTLCLKLLNTNKPPHTALKDLNSFVDARNLIHPKKKSLISNEVKYHQMFGNDFVQDLSILDILFCEGPLAHPIVMTQLKTTVK